jgi:sec-independent protein translocase protein TatA
LLPVDLTDAENWEIIAMFLKEPSHILILLLVLVLLFGAKRLPDSARSLAKSLRIFKSEMKDINKDGIKADDEGASEK